MDVHPPERPIHTWKDFLIHLLTITVGLFIALSLEAAVESMHHRHLVRDGRNNLDREISFNAKLYPENVRRLQDNRDRLRSDIAQLRDLRDGKSVQNPSLSWRGDWDGFTGTAWTTARDSGAVSYMDPKVISSYSLIYRQQDYVNSTALKIFDEETKAGAALEIAGDPKNLMRPQIDALLLKSAELDLSIDFLQSITKGLNQMYVDAMEHPL